MNDDRLDELLATLANPISDGAVSSLDLGSAETELMEDIMATAPPPRRRPHRPHRHRRLVGAVAATTVALGALGAGLYLFSRDDADDRVDTVQEPTTTTSTTADVPSPAPPPQPACDERAIPEETPTVPPSEIPDAMRVLPTWTPDGVAISSASGARWPGCPGQTYNPDSALDLTTDRDGDGVVDATIYVRGPLPEPYDENVGVGRNPIQLRGLAAVQYDPTYADDVGFAWTEADGWSWDVSGYGVDEATVRAVAENLVLDSSPEGDEPAADLAPAAVPAGFTVGWQLRGAPVLVGGDQTTWSVMVGVPMAVQTGTICHLDVRQNPGKAPLTGGTGSQAVTIGGRPGYWGARFGLAGQDGLGMELIWEIAPNVVAIADCSTWDSRGGHGLPLETVLQFAESLVPVAADDPRLSAATG